MLTGQDIYRASYRYVHGMKAPKILFTNSRANFDDVVTSFPQISHLYTRSSVTLARFSPAPLQLRLLSFLPTSLPPELQLRALAALDNDVDNTHLPALKPLPRRPLQLLRRPDQVPNPATHVRNLLIPDFPSQTRTPEPARRFSLCCVCLEKEPVVRVVRVAVINTPVVHDEDEDIHVVPCHRLDLHRRESKGAIPLQTHHLLPLPTWPRAPLWRWPVISRMCRNSVAQAHAHSRVRAGIEP